MGRLGSALTLGFAFLYIHTEAAIAGRWTEVSAGLTGPIAGARSLIVDGAGTTLYVVTAGNGVFKSSDGGSSWNIAGGVTAVQVLAIDPAMASTVYAGTWRGLFKSTDGAKSWNKAGLSASISSLAVDPITPSTVYAAGVGDHVYKTIDGGESWSDFALGLPESPFNGISSIILDPVTPSTVYVNAYSEGPGSLLYKSTDGGQTWNVIEGGSVLSLMAIDPVTPSTMYALRRRTGFSKSTDGGASWTQIGYFACVEFPCRTPGSVAIDPGNPNIVYVGASAPVGTPAAIYKSTDGGQNWNLLNMTIPFAQSLVLNPADSSVIYAGNYKGGVFKSSDGGVNWSESNTGLRAPGIQVLADDPGNPTAIYAGGDGGLFKSEDRGGSWKQQAVFEIGAGVIPPGFPPPPPGLTPSSATASVRSLLIDFTNPNVLYAGTHRTDGCFFSDILLFKSTDDGATWSDSVSPTTSGCTANSLLAIDPTDGNTLYLQWGDDIDGFGLRKSTDGGATWGYGGPSAELNTLTIDPTSPATLYAGTNDGVFQSTDGGGNWSRIGLAKTNVNLLAIDPLAPNIIYAEGTGGPYKSTDKGASWSPINKGLENIFDFRVTATALVPDPHHTGILYLATSGYGVFKSSDGGATWSAFNDGLTQLEVRTLAIGGGDQTTVYAGTPGGVFRIVEE